MNRSPIEEAIWVRRTLIGLSALFVLVMVVLPVASVFYEAFSHGIGAYLKTFTDENNLIAIRLTVEVAAIAVPLNLIFGLAASWAISKFDFVGKHFLMTLVDLPFSVSPVIAGLIFVLLLGTNSALGHWLDRHGIDIIFAFPGLVIATIFVTFPFVARELIPLMQDQGKEEEEAALLLGASGWQTFRRITLPNIRWGLLYGILLCTARAMGEFGAVTVVSGNIQGVTNTVPLQVQTLYDEYNMVGAFALASTLTILAVVTLVIKTAIEWKYAGSKKYL